MYCTQILILNKRVPVLSIPPGLVTLIFFVFSGIFATQLFKLNPLFFLMERTTTLTYMRTLMETEHFLAQLSPMVMFGLSLRSSVRIAHPLWAVDEAMHLYDRTNNCVQTLKCKPSTVVKKHKWRCTVMLRD